MSKGVDGVFFKLKHSQMIDNESGQNLVEFALVIPIFVLILMGMIDFGWYLKLNHDLVRANSQGAREAAYAADDSVIKQTVVDMASDSLVITSEGVTVVREDINKIRGTFVEVNSTSSYTSVTGFSIIHLLLNEKPLEASSTVRIE